MMKYNMAHKYGIWDWLDDFTHKKVDLWLIFAAIGMIFAIALARGIVL